MKSVIFFDRDSDYTIEHFRKEYQRADEILSNNGLPYLEHSMDPIADQLRMKGRDLLENLALLEYPDDPADEAIEKFISAHYNSRSQLSDIQNSLSDLDKALAISDMTPEEYVIYQITGMMTNALLVPATLTDEQESAEDITRDQVKQQSTVIGANRVLSGARRVPRAPSPNRNMVSAYSKSWFWAPRGDVIFECGGRTLEIPAWPENVKDDVSVTWSQEMTTYQHYQPTNTYKGSGPRTVSCSFKLHRAMWDGNQDSGDFEEVIALLESACYPDYDVEDASPPLCTLIVGSSISITGIMTSFSCTYQGAIGPGNAYDEGIVSIAITEVSDVVLDNYSVAIGRAGAR